MYIMMYIFATSVRSFQAQSPRPGEPLSDSEYWTQPSSTVALRVGSQMLITTLIQRESSVVKSRIHRQDATRTTAAV
jgi:hypothetical protein